MKNEWHRDTQLNFWITAWKKNCVEKSSIVSLERGT